MAKLKFHPTVKSFDIVNARALARASQLAYQDEDDILRILKSWGFPKGRFFAGRRKGTEGFVAGNADVILVAFRGTEVDKIKDWISDFKIKKVPAKGGGHVHRGFKAALESVSKKMVGAVHEFQDAGQPVFVTGHSLGAALAGLAVGASATEGLEIAGLYTYGMPRAGNKVFAKKFSAAYGMRSFRVVNNNDTVTRVPPGLFRYKHVGIVKYLNADGELESGETPWKRFKQRVKGQVQGRIKDFLKLGPDGLKDHSIGRYVKILNKLEG